LPDDPAVRQEKFLLAASGILVAAAWPPLPLGFLTYIGLVLPLDIVSRKRFGAAFKSGYLFAFAYHLFSLYWISWVTVPGTILAIGIISLYTAFILALFAEVYQHRRLVALILFPFLWAGMEYFRTLLEIAFPWSNLSYTQGSYTALIQVCEYIGDIGLSFMLVVFNLLIWRAWRSRRRMTRAILALAAGLLVVLPVIYGARVLAKAEPVNTGPIRVALLQGDVSLDIKWNPEERDRNFRLYDSLAQAAVPADLLVWPETAAPAYLSLDYLSTNVVAQTARRVKTPMLVGTLDAIRHPDGAYETFNAAIQFDADGRHREPYHKNKLVPFAEAVPYGRFAPFLVNLPVGWSDFEHGHELRVYENEFGAYGTLICYEVIFPEVVNRYVQMGADFLVNITNDTWYGYSSGPYQHAGMAVFRAVENRISIARAANSGFSYFVDRYGRRFNVSRLYERTVVKGNIAPIAERTIFNRTGPIIGRAGLLSIGVVSCIFLVLWIRRKTVR
jgi:apolipoprotein N-acyltransferase